MYSPFLFLMNRIDSKTLWTPATGHHFRILMNNFGLHDDSLYRKIYKIRKIVVFVLRLSVKTNEVF